MIQELIVRLLQTKAKYTILNDHLEIFSDTRIGSVVKYIKENLTDKSISIDKLAEKAYMSTSNFHKKFKNTLGISPIDFMNSEAKLLKKHRFLPMLSASPHFGLLVSKCACLILLALNTTFEPI